MNSDAIDRIVGDMPTFMRDLELREIAKEWLDPSGAWTHLQDLDAIGEKFFDDLVKVGIIRKGEAVPKHGKAVTVYALKV